MTATAYAFALVGAITTLVLMGELLRRRRLREKYAALWLLVGCGVLVVALVPDLLASSARLVGIQAPVNLLFFVAALVLLVVSVQLSTEVSSLEEETRTLAEELGVLRLRVEQLEERQGLVRRPRDDAPPPAPDDR